MKVGDEWAESEADEFFAWIERGRLGEMLADLDKMPSELKRSAVEDTPTIVFVYPVGCVDPELGQMPRAMYTYGVQVLTGSGELFTASTRVQRRTLSPGLPDAPASLEGGIDQPGSLEQKLPGSRRRSFQLFISPDELSA
jgi:hypothetical protein